MNAGIKRRFGWGLVLATSMAMIAAIVVFAPAHAGLLTTPPTMVKISDSKITATCTWTAKSANHSEGTVTGNLSGSVRPKTLTVPRAVVHVGIFCEVGDPNRPGFMAGHFEEADGSVVRFTVPKTVLLIPGYEVCAVVRYTLRNGETWSPPQKCS